VWRRCIEIGKQIDGITAGERDGKIAEGLSYGNSPFEYPREFIQDKTLVLTTTNGTKLLHMALDNGAKEIVIGAFSNLNAVCNHLDGIKKECDACLCSMERPGEPGRYIVCGRSHFENKRAL
jgi:2-phosphosulfolactate phosphatase